MRPPAPLKPDVLTKSRVRFRRQPQAWLYALWKFSRPHTIVGTSLSVLGLLAIAGAAILPSGTVASLDIGQVGITLAIAWLACLAGNVYIVGLNQLEDIAIDRINKPHLPLASGEFTVRDGQKIVGMMAVLALGLALLGGPWLAALVTVSLIIGTAYSLPPVRLKRFPFWASFCILAVRGAVVNLGLFLHYSDRFGLPLTIPPRVWALTGFVLVFSIAIAIFKDIPDIEGDRRYGIRTFTVDLGQRPVFNIARGVLTGCYLAIPLVSPWLEQINRPFLIITHLLVLAVFWGLSFRVEGFERVGKPQHKLTYPAFYQFIWKLFFLEYILFPLACWLI